MGLFNKILKKENHNKCVGVGVFAPIGGKCIPLEEVNDEAFSSKILGDGFAIEPNEDVVCSPCSGEIIMMFPSGHAFGIKLYNGIEVMVHIGIDSINAHGNGFKIYKKMGDRVDAGEKIVQINKSAFDGIDLTTMVLFSQIKDGLKVSNLHKIVTVNTQMISEENLLEAIKENESNKEN